ncbi:probable WRKY transcription factor 46 [Hibiscus syriacus]|uniref:probable WRKY transcription factor 46 n=1 Tax=Hibiscus syriacus TaxID=106335 RepID=UPI001923773C|nr:probable WRKY transcription factor 46 [Hibiscus syriacus]
MDWERSTLLKEQTQGRELTNLLRNHLHPSSPPKTRQVLLDKILFSYDKALSMLKCNSPGSDASDRKDSFKKRKKCSGWSEQVRICSGTSLEGPLDDGHCWRKYGQKDILGSNFPRGYHRCTHRYTQGCLAAKQVQRSDEDPTIFEVKYRGRHTCNRASHFVATKVPSTTESEEKGNQKQQNQLEEKQKQSKEIWLSFETELKVKTEALDNRGNIFPSFSFPIGSEEVEYGLFF